MPTTYPRDRFDDVPRQSARVGAHRAEQPRAPRRVVLLWAALATVLLTIAGILAFLVLSQRVDIVPGQQSPVPQSTVSPIVDPTYTVLVLNGTGSQGVAEEVAAELVAAGWSDDMVLPSESSATDFPATTVYYASPEEEAVALGIAQAIGGARVALSDQYQSPPDPALKEITVVAGLDRVSAG
ncbi:LytR C-terminal domain-containing protein [Microbacterium sp. MEC084]|uniref:LytR C-terminal domain-containing protein n=1 Tax=Microbacterium sp. MEC084 TaxID=1963027 RepID=UPI001101A92B|nr:LytR C-terminal domain-containing protein [Microbacterium sp. MEC084]